MDTLTLEKRAADEGLYRKIHQLPPAVQHELSDYIEFLLDKYQAKQPERPYFGCMRGTVTWMGDDFNAPLDDFKEYM
jgi:hypothetical protein